MARRSGSAFTGAGTVFLKEFADHLGGARMLVLEWLVLITGIGAVYTAIQDLKQTTGQDPFLFLRLFTQARDPLPSFVSVLAFLIPLMAIGLGFDGINSEFSRRTMSRILAQPIYRDALLLGKFLAGLATIAVALVTLWLLVVGLGPRHAGRAAQWRGGDAQRGVSGGRHRLWRGVARGGAVVLGVLPLGRDLGAGGARPVAPGERAVALDRAVHHHRGLPARCGADHLRPAERRSDRAAADAVAALAEHALRRIACWGCCIRRRGRWGRCSCRSSKAR